MKNHTTALKYSISSESDLLTSLGAMHPVRLKSIRFFAFLIYSGIFISLLFSCPKSQAQSVTKIATFEEAMKSSRDLWGEAAMAQPNGPSYDFFAKLLPPPRYVNADFRYYPIVLSAPESAIKARLISNGSGINTRGGVHSWRDVGIPFTFRVGPDDFIFGSISDRLEEPSLVEGWLPIPQICYAHTSPFQSEGMVPLNSQRKTGHAEIYRLEAFAGTDPVSSQNGVVYVKFDLKQGSDGYIAVEAGVDSVNLKEGRLLDEYGNVIALFDSSWKKEKNLIKARLTPGSSATMAIATKPFGGNLAPVMNNDAYESQRELCIQTWKKKISEGMEITTPETLVNNACRNSLCQIFQLVNGNNLFYSAGNQYQKMYEAEGSDALQALLNYGYTEETKRYMIPLFDFSRKGLELHNAGFKIIDLCQYYWHTRDKKAVEELRPYWEKEAKMLDKGRTGPGGLYPEEQYCGDIHTLVQSLNVNAHAWRAMRDLGAVLRKTGYKKEADHYIGEALTFRKVVLDAIHKTASHETVPPFVPIALNGGEPVHDPILHSRIGSYWNIIIGYTIQSNIFPSGSEEENWIPNYQEKHGGICMGMIRSGGGQWNFWTGEYRINPLYGTRYSLNTLLRDDTERSLVSFYGMLAQGLTRNTFIGGEGCSLGPMDNKGRVFYCPPNSAASAHLLSMLRNILVQDWDLDDDGKPETLRLAFATPRTWLEDGKTIEVKNAPTAFGKTSFSIKSNLKNGEVELNFTPPSLTPDKTLVRIRIPDGWKVKSASAGSREFKADEKGTVDLTSIKEPTAIHFKVVQI